MSVPLARLDQFSFCSSYPTLVGLSHPSSLTVRPWLSSPDDRSPSRPPTVAISDPISRSSLHPRSAPVDPARPLLARTTLFFFFLRLVSGSRLEIRKPAQAMRLFFVFVNFFFPFVSVERLTLVSWLLLLFFSLFCLRLCFSFHPGQHVVFFLVFLFFFFHSSNPLIRNPPSCGCGPRSTATSNCLSIAFSPLHF